MQQLRYALGRFARSLGSAGSYGRGSSRVRTWGWLFYGFALVVGITLIISTAVNAQAEYNRTYDEPFYQATLSHDPGEIAVHLENGLAKVKDAGLATGNAVTVMPPEPSNDAAPVTKGYESLIKLAHEVDGLDRNDPAYRLALTDLKTRVDGMDNSIYFMRWTRLYGYWAATLRGFDWAMWNILVLSVLSALAAWALIEGAVFLHRKAYDWAPSGVSTR